MQVDAQVDWAGQDAYLIGWGSPFDPDDHTYKVFGTDKGEMCIRDSFLHFPIALVKGYGVKPHDENGP